MGRDAEGARVLRWVGRGIRYVVLLLAACLVTMTASFVLVRQLTPLVGQKAVGDEAVEKAQRWRATARELVELTAEFAAVTAGAEDPSDDAFRTRVAQGVLPRVNDLRRRIVGLTASDETDMTLLRAADALADAMARPGSGELRLRATEDVLAAVEVVETRIEVLGVGPRAGAVVDVGVLRSRK